MIITNVSQKTVDALKAQLTSTHQSTVTTSPDPTRTGNTTGQINGHGVVANYSYSASTQTLTVNVQHHPFFIPESHLEASLRDAIAKLTPAAMPAEPAFAPVPASA